MINIVFESILEEKKLHFNILHRHLHRNEQSVAFVFKVKNYYVIENNIKSIANVFITKIDLITKFENFYKWHQLLVHSNNEIIEHLAQIVERMTIIDAINFNETVSKINKCEICALIKAHILIFRFSAKSKTSNKSFFRITYDLIQLNIIMNKNQWISHVACFKYDFHLIYTHAHKLKAFEIIIKVINLIKTKYNDKVIFIKSDEKRSLKTQFTNYTSIKDIIYEFSASNTFAQNEHIERKKSILLIKEKALRLEINLSIYLWSWIVRIAEYIMNKILMKKHEWKIFFEVVIESKFNLIHLI